MPVAVAAVSCPLRPGKDAPFALEGAEVIVVAGTVVTTPFAVKVVAGFVETAGDAGGAVVVAGAGRPRFGCEADPRLVEVEDGVYILEEQVAHEP